MVDPGMQAPQNPTAALTWAAAAKKYKKIGQLFGKHDARFIRLDGSRLRLMEAACVHLCALEELDRQVVVTELPTVVATPGMSPAQRLPEQGNLWVHELRQ